MKYVPRMPIPWDTLVFLTLTTAGFGFSVHRLVAENRLGDLLSDSHRQLNLETDAAASMPTTADLGCIERSLPTQRIKSDMGSIRLRGKLCNMSRRAMRAFEGIQVRNRTNGFEGTVFFQGYDTSFVTDYVVLQPGTNEIEISWRDRAGAPAHTIIAKVFE